jgi:UDP-glucuronate decarboxylase
MPAGRISKTNLSSVRQDQIKQGDGNFARPVHTNRYGVSEQREIQMREQMRRSGVLKTNDLSSGHTAMAQAATVTRVAPRVYSPLFELSNLQLPRDRRTMNSWVRYFYDCYDMETETLTNKGFLKWNEIIEIEENEALGVNIAKGLKDPEIEIACFNPDTECIEYRSPLSCSVYNFSTMGSGDKMVHFQTKKIDMCVTPNHRMYVDTIGNAKWRNDWKIIKANDVKPKVSRFRSRVNWEGETAPPIVKIGDKEITTIAYLKLLGYYVSEGSLTHHYKNGVKDKAYGVLIAQQQYRNNVEQKAFIKIGKDLEMLRYGIWVSGAQEGLKRGNFKDGKLGVKYFGITDSDLATHLKQECGDNSKNKRIPSCVKSWSKTDLTVLLDALLRGDGTERYSDSWNLQGTNHVKANIYTTSSKQLADDVYEIAYKCGYVPTLYQYTNAAGTLMHIVSFTESSIGHFPVLKTQSKQLKGREKEYVNYEGIVYCFHVPPHNLFVTRRNGKVTIQGNTNPIVRNSINLHATYPVSKFNVVCEDK